MKRVLLGLVLLAGLLFAAWVYRKQSDPPPLAFAKVIRETISNTLSTNGKVEPFDYAEVRVDTAGLVKRLPVYQGENMVKGQLLAHFSQPGLPHHLSAPSPRAAPL